MPKHVWMMWLLAGGGTLVGASLTYLATRPVLAPASGRLRSSWRRIRDWLPILSKRRAKHSLAPRPLMSPSGSSAFDEYRAAQIASLEHEAHEFREFLKRLREARDREEFDAYLREKKAGRAKPPVTIDNE